MIALTAAQLQKATGCTHARAELFLPFLQGAMKAYDINTPKRVAGFLSQISHESGQLETLQESLNYSVDAMLRMFGRHRISEADARRYGRTATQKANQEAIANALYGGDWGRKNLGNTQPGDGWRYRGRGLKQLTGRANYADFSAAIGEDFVAEPDRLLLPVNAALSAGWFWGTNGLNALADRGDVPAMTKRINGGDIGLKERTALYGQAMQVLA
jgi:putative chitinase